MTSPFRVSLFTVAATHADGSPRTDRLIEASIQWAERIMRKIDPCLELRFDDNAGLSDHVWNIEELVGLLDAKPASA